MSSPLIFWEREGRGVDDMRILLEIVRSGSGSSHLGTPPLSVCASWVLFPLLWAFFLFVQALLSHLGGLSSRLYMGSLLVPSLLSGVQKKKRNKIKKEKHWLTPKTSLLMEVLNFVPRRVRNDIQFSFEIMNPSLSWRYGISSRVAN